MYFPRAVNRAIITWFGCGRVPVAPGTAGSIGALPLCWLMAAHADLWVRFVFALGMTAIAIIAAGQDQLDSPTKDPGYVVVDEVAGMLWSTLLMPPGWISLLVAFVLFRVFDVVKPFPANLFDRRSKKAAGAFARGFHIVMDDVVAGLYVMLVLQLLIAYTSPHFQFFHI